MSDAFGEPLHPLAGGYSGETYVAGEGADRVVVRIYARTPGRAAIDASLLHLVRGLVPAPRVLELRRPTAGTPAVLVTEFVEGVRLDTALATRATLDFESLGRSLAHVVDALAGIPFLDSGMFADDRLTVANADLPDDLRAWAEHLRPRGRLSLWAERDWAALLSLVDSADCLADDATRRSPPRSVLVHSDLNPKNVLVSARTSAVVALLDWEFAYAGSPFADLGNLCRFERDPRFVQPLLAALAPYDGGALGPTERLHLGRALDLWALVELAGRPEPSPMHDLATELLLAQARAGDLDAWPWDDARVDPPGRAAEDSADTR